MSVPACPARCRSSRSALPLSYYSAQEQLEVEQYMAVNASNVPGYLNAIYFPQYWLGLTVRAWLAGWAEAALHDCMTHRRIVIWSALSCSLQALVSGSEALALVLSNAACRHLQHRLCASCSAAEVSVSVQHVDKP